MSFADLSRFLGEPLQNPTAVNDAELRRWCRAAKGYPWGANRHADPAISSISDDRPGLKQFRTLNHPPYFELNLFLASYLEAASAGTAFTAMSHMPSE
jgi:hypothetical protein